MARTKTIDSVRELISFANSGLRIIASFFIFAFHCYGRYGSDAAVSLVRPAFAVFLFTSGYYAPLRSGMAPRSWFTRRLERIYVPYLITAASVLIVNAVVHYKPVDWSAAFFLLIGANWLHPEPLYVIVWYVTLILCIYLATFFYHLASNPVVKACIAVFASLGMIYLGSPIYFVAAFIGGYALAKMLELYGVSRRVLPDGWLPSLKIREGIYALQDYSYEFFLLHGGVILFYQEIAHWAFAATFWASLVTAAVLSVGLRRAATALSRVTLRHA